MTDCLQMGCATVNFGTAGPFPGSGITTASFVSNKVPTTHNLPNGITKNQNLNSGDPNKVQHTPNEADEGLQRLSAVAISADGQKCTDPHHVFGNIDEVSKPTEDSSSPAMDVIVKTTISSYSQKKSAVAIDPNIIKEKVRNKKANGKLNELTVVELKAFLSASKAKVGGKKEELIQRVIALVC